MEEVLPNQTEHYYSGNKIAALGELIIIIVMLDKRNVALNVVHE
jgi:hypothetical protein